MRQVLEKQFQAPKIIFKSSQLTWSHFCQSHSFRFPYEVVHNTRRLKYTKLTQGSALARDKKFGIFSEKYYIELKFVVFPRLVDNAGLSFSKKRRLYYVKFNKHMFKDRKSKNELKRVHERTFENTKVMRQILIV